MLLLLLLLMMMINSYRWNDMERLQSEPGCVVSLRPVNGSQWDMNGA